jgi:hypothetical protein
MTPDTDTQTTEGEAPSWEDVEAEADQRRVDQVTAEEYRAFTKWLGETHDIHSVQEAKDSGLFSAEELAGLDEGEAAVARIEAGDAQMRGEPVDDVEPPTPTIDVRGLIAAVEGGPDASARDALIAGWSAEERAAIESVGYVLPLAVAPDDVAFVARPDAEVDVHQLDAELRAFDKRPPDYVDAETLERLRELHARASAAPPSAGTAAAQEFVAALEAVRTERDAARPFGRVISRTWTTTADGGQQLEESNSRGDTRVEKFSGEAVRDAVAERDASPEHEFDDLDQDDVTAETLAGWPMDKRLRWKERFPGRFEQLKAGE